MESALRHVVGSSTMDNVITEGLPPLVVARCAGTLAELPQPYQTGIVGARRLNIDERRSPGYPGAEAFDDVQKAKEDEARYVNERMPTLKRSSRKHAAQRKDNSKRSNAYRDRVVAAKPGARQTVHEAVEELPPGGGGHAPTALLHRRHNSRS